MDLLAYRSRSSACWRGRARARLCADLWWLPIRSEHNYVLRREEKRALSPRTGNGRAPRGHTFPRCTQTRHGSSLDDVHSGTVLVPALAPAPPATRALPLLSPSRAANSVPYALCRAPECLPAVAETSLPAEGRLARRHVTQRRNICAAWRDPECLSSRRAWAHPRLLEPLRSRGGAPDACQSSSWELRE